MFPVRLKAVRKSRNLTQQSVADALNITARSFQRYEAINGFCEPPMTTLVQIADLLDVSLDYLLCRDAWLKSHEARADEHT